jgi:hypothetical protein
VLADVLSDVHAASDDLIGLGNAREQGIEVSPPRLFEWRAGQRVMLTTALGRDGIRTTGQYSGACLAGGTTPHGPLWSTEMAGLQLNIQDARGRSVGLRFPIKLLRPQQRGYASIRTSAAALLRTVDGADVSSGVTLPPLQKVVEAYGLTYSRIENQHDLAARSSACSISRSDRLRGDDTRWTSHVPRASRPCDVRIGIHGVQAARGSLAFSSIARSSCRT